MTIEIASLGLRSLAKSFAWACCIWVVFNFLCPAALAQDTEDAAKVVETTVGKQFIIELDSNITTGYGWKLQKAVDGLLVKSVGNEYKTTPRPPRPPGEPPMSGGGGKEFWTFKALQPGQTTIDFKYVRPWEADKAPAKNASFRVVIKGAAEAVTPAQDNAPIQEQPLDGAPGRYKEYAGTAEIVRVEKTAASDANKARAAEGYEVWYTFTAKDNVPEKGKIFLDQHKQHQFVLGSSYWCPGPKFLKKYGIEKGKKFDAALMVSASRPTMIKLNDVPDNDFFEATGS